MNIKPVNPTWEHGGDFKAPLGHEEKVNWLRRGEGYVKRRQRDRDIKGYLQDHGMAEREGHVVEGTCEVVG